MAGKQRSSYEDRDRAIANFIVQYGGVFNAVISEVFLGGRAKHAGSVIKILEQKGHVVIHRRLLPGGANFTTPSVDACRSAGVSPKRATLTRGSASLDALVQRLAYCTLGATRRYPVTAAEMMTLVGTTWQPNVHHVLTTEYDTPRVLRVYSALTNRPHNAIKSLRNHIEDAMSKCRAAVKAGDYGLVTLAKTEAHCEQLRALIAKAKLHNQAFVEVAYAPDVSGLSRFLKRRRKPVSDSPKR